MPTLGPNPSFPDNFSVLQGALVNDGYAFPLLSLSIMLGIKTTVVSSGVQIFCTAFF